MSNLEFHESEVVKAFEEHRNAEDRAHRRLETCYWKRTFWSNIVTVALTLVLAGGAGCSALYSYLALNESVKATNALTEQTKAMIDKTKVLDVQAKLMADQIAIADGPDIEVTELHIWKQGEGRNGAATNKLPELVAGQWLDGAAYIANLGSNPAMITGSYLDVFWRDTDLNMINPLWGTYGLEHWSLEIGTIAPGANQPWMFWTVVPRTTGKRLYVLGDIYYKSEQGVLKRRYFARFYSPATGKFIKLRTPRRTRTHSEPKTSCSASWRGYRLQRRQGDFANRLRRPHPQVPVLVTRRLRRVEGDLAKVD